MPEGPEVRRAADKIEKALQGKKIENISLTHPSVQGAHSFILGSTLIRVDTYGKAFVLVFDSDVAIYVHLQLYGVWKTGRVTTQPKTTRQLHIRLESTTHHASLYSATDISLLHVHDVLRHPYIKKLGPDLLSSTCGVAQVSRRMQGASFARKSIGIQLLKQSFFAGVGNYLRSEILFIAGVHPAQVIGKLSPKRRLHLARSIYHTTQRAYKTGGITTSDAFVAQAKEKNKRRYQYRHYVFGKEQQSCPTCADTIQKIMTGGRRLYLCPSCQIV